MGVSDDPPVPVEAANVVGHSATDESQIPDGFVDDEYVFEQNDMTAMKAGVECPNCGSDVFYHPRSIVPHNTVQCFNCQHTAWGYAWWETRRLDDYAESVGGDC
jgi:DNA-directed RNA polymerase subunit RPC12/RpoP